MNLTKTARTVQDTFGEYIDRDGNFELYFDQNAFPFEIKRFDKINIESDGTLKLKFTTTDGANVKLKIDNYGDAEITIIELADE